MAVIMSRGFSLIELMVVVALIGIISVVGTGVYRGYKLKAVMSEKVSAAHLVLDQFAVNYARNGDFGTAVLGPQNIVPNTHWQRISGNYLGLCGYTAISTNSRLTLRLITRDDALYAMEDYLPVCYNPVGCINCQFEVGLRVNNGIITRACGSPTSEVRRYLPQNCQCTNVHSWTSTGTGVGC